MSSRGNGNDDDLPGTVATPLPAEREEAAAGDASAEEAGLAESAPADPLEALRKECFDLRDALLRRRAEFENYRRRVERDRGSAAAEAEAGICARSSPPWTTSSGRSPPAARTRPFARASC